MFIMSLNNMENSIINELVKFLSEFKIKEDNKEILYYREQVYKMEKNKISTLYINFLHLLNYFQNDIPQLILFEYLKFEIIINKAIKIFITELLPDYSTNKNFVVSFFNLLEIFNIRELKTNKIGRLISVQGIVTKTTDVKPELIEASFYCLNCNSIVNNIIQQFNYTEPKKCPNHSCLNKTQWELIAKKSKIIDWQKITIQETNHSDLTGSMPRNIDIIMRNEQTEKCQPGDLCIFTGVLIVVPDKYIIKNLGEKFTINYQKKNDLKRNNLKEEKIKNLGLRDINYKLLFLCNNTKKYNNKWDLNINSNENFYENLSKEDKDEILKMKNDPHIYSNLVNSICPNIFGNVEIKKGLLLLLFGGVTKITDDDTKLRGDINICIVGDPSTGKSQFLKFINNFLPRSVYTSGKSTSSAGLTASVQKDYETGEFIIEAGALILADNGVCCIDEFDKINEKDQVSIHEAMEQQTISISKAGIQATLNARTSILAALNPILGRYDKSKSLRYNLHLSDPIISRFDLLFVSLDLLDQNKDKLLANHILDIHSFELNENKLKYDIQKIKRYIQFAKNINPKLNIEAAEEIKIQYLKLRMNDISFRENYRITVRQIESIIRLSEALARIFLSDVITKEHVKESVKLINDSLIKITKQDYEIEFENQPLLVGNINEIPKNLEQQEVIDTNNEFISPKKEKIKIKYEEYNKIKNNIIMIINNNDKEALKKSDLISKVFFEFKNLINNNEELDKIEKKINGVIKRMIQTEKILINTGAEDTDKLLMIHPNYNN